MAHPASPFTPDETARAASAIARFASLGWMVATAESCTGGLVAALLTEVAGSSAVVDRGFVTYSNDAKQDLLGVPAEVLASCGAVSLETAIAMAEGALTRSRARCAVSITGIAGPGGGSSSKPVGLVHFGLAVSGTATKSLERRFGDMGRAAVRRAALYQALELLEDALTHAEGVGQAGP